MSIDTTGLLEDFRRSKKFRDEFVAAHAKQSIPMQIGDMLEQQDLTQKQLGERAGLTQGAISRAADPTYGNLTINTCVKVASGFDVVFVPLFVPYSRFLRWLDRWDDFIEFSSFETECDRGVFDAIASDISGVAESSGAITTRVEKLDGIDVRMAWADIGNRRIVDVASDNERIRNEGTDGLKMEVAF